MARRGSIAVSDATLREIRLLQATRPGQEVCGFIAEDNGGTQRFMAVETLGSSVGFALPACEAARVQQVAADHGWRLVALLHTHPFGPAGPSEHDIAQARRSPIPWLVAAATHDASEWTVEQA